MIKLIRNILILLSLFVLYVIGKELLLIISYTKSIHIYLMYSVIAVISILFIIYILFPFLKILLFPKVYSTTSNKNKVVEIRNKRLDHFKKNPYLKEIKYDIEHLEYTDESYENICSLLSKRCGEIRRKYVGRIFLTTGISQNGFLDAFFILSGSFQMTKEIFELYHGRVNNYELLKIFKKIYLSMALGGSGLVEYITEELMTKFARDLTHSVPFLGKFTASMADGIVNAAVFTWISIITENYCKIIYIEKDRDLYPKPTFFYDTVRNLAGGVIDKMIKIPFNNTKSKTKSFFRWLFNIDPDINEKRECE